MAFSPLYRSTFMNRHLIAFITFVALIPLVYFIPEWVSRFLIADRLGNVIISVAIIVPLISYLVLPLTQAWLAPRYKTTPEPKT